MNEQSAKALAAVTQNGLALKDVNEQASKVRLETTNEPDIQERLDSLYNSFEENPKALTDFLTFKSKFYSYSLRNTLLIFSQKRDATFIGSKTKFAELGYNILPECKDKGMYAYKCVKSYFFYRDKKPINTSKATNEEKELLKSGKLKTYNKKYFEKYMVYDIAHTDCPKEDYPLLYSQGKPSLSHKKMYENFKEALKKMQINFKEENLYSIALSGSYNKSTNTIKINSMLDDTEKLNTIIHETAHALLHKTSNQPIEIKEFEAQALANLLQGELGLELEPNDIKYMCTYMDKVKQCKGFNLANSLTRITKQSDFIKKNINLEISATKAHPKEMAMTMEITNVLQ
ncbi:MAG: ImmA/IrrE family metallo-endopeptidase [Oscillospiraceae bacterium]